MVKAVRGQLSAAHVPEEMKFKRIKRFVEKLFMQCPEQEVQWPKDPEAGL